MYLCMRVYIASVRMYKYNVHPADVSTTNSEQRNIIPRGEGRGSDHFPATFVGR